MKKKLVLLLATLMCISLCACGRSESSTNEVSVENTTKTDEKEITENEIGDTVSTDVAEVVLLNVSYEDTYGIVTPKEGYSFVVVDFSLKNIGKTNLAPFPTQGQGKSYVLGDIVSVDYNNGYTFFVDNVEGKDGSTYNESSMKKTSDDLLISDLKPLSDAATAQAAICVPNEVVENTNTPLLIKINLLNSEGEKVTAVYSIR